jgi:hypothetical protein
MPHSHPPKSKALKEARQIHHLEQGKDNRKGIVCVTIISLINGKYFLQTMGEFLELCDITGIAWVNFQFRLLQTWLAYMTTRRFTPTWSPEANTCAPLNSEGTRSIVVGTVVNRQLRYFSSCSLACSAYPSKQAVSLVWDATTGSRCGNGSFC